MKADLFEIEFAEGVPVKLHACEDGKTRPSIVPITTIDQLAPRERGGEVTGAFITTRSGGRYEIPCDGQQYDYLYDCYNDVRKAKENAS